MLRFALGFPVQIIILFLVNKQELKAEENKLNFIFFSEDSSSPSRSYYGDFFCKMAATKIAKESEGITDNRDHYLE